MPTNPNYVMSGVTKTKNTTPSVGGRYQSLIDANPYRNQEYQNSPWQNFMSMLGFRTQADAWRENMAVQAAEYDAAIMQKKYDEEYNDPESQLARMRAAGLNPDIDGGSSINPGQAVGLPEDPSTPMQSTSDAESFQPVINGVLGAFSTALGMVNSMQGVIGNHLQNVFSSITNEKEFASFAEGISGSLLPPSPTPDGALNFDWKSVALSNAEKFANFQLPKNMRKKFVDFQEQFWNSASGQYKSYEDFRNAVTSRRGWAEDRSYFYTDLGNDVLLSIVEPLVAAQEKLYQQSLKTDTAVAEAAEAGAQTEQAYQIELDGSLMGAAQNAQNKNVVESAGSQAIINETIHGIIENLKVTSKEGGLKGALASIAMVLISGLYLYGNSSHHVSVSRSEGSGSFSGPKSSGSHSNRSFSLGF